MVAVGSPCSLCGPEQQSGEVLPAGEDHAAQGRWDLAADAFAEAAKINPKYRDVQSKLSHARQQAEKDADNRPG